MTLPHDLPPAEAYGPLPRRLMCGADAPDTLTPVGFENPRHHVGRICQLCYTDLYTEDGAPWGLLEDLVHEAALHPAPVSFRSADQIEVERFLRHDYIHPWTGRDA